MPEVTIYHDDGSTETIPTTTGYVRREEIGAMWKLTIRVDRDLAQTVSLTRKEDEIELDGYRGVLADLNTGGSVWTLEVYSPEWYGKLTEPIAGGTRVQGDDQTLITDRINAVGEWTVGNVASLTGPMTFVFNHAFNHEALRKIEKNTPGELQFNSDGTVDYVDSLGTDRSGSVELSASAGTIEQDIQITERGRKLDATHVRVIGAHEGEAQRFATLVPDDDGATYENRVNYTTDRWAPGDERDWDRWQNKDVMAQDTIEEEAAALGAELPEQYVEVRTTVSGVELNLGDWVQVVKPDADLDRRMRVHQLKTKSVDGTPAAEVQEVLLSTRTLMREERTSDQRDIQRFNTAFQGSSVAINAGPLRAAIDSGFPVMFPVRYPDLEFENTATLQVRGLPYRTDSKPLEHSHDVSFSIGDHSHSVTIPDHTHDVSFDLPDHVHNISNNDSVTRVTSQTDVGGGGHDHIYEYPTVTDNPSTNPTTATSSAAGGGTTETTDGGGSFTTTETSDTAAGSEAGIFETTDTPSNVDVLIGGDVVASNIGSGEFQTTVNVDGEFTRDDWNAVEIQSDTLGVVQVTVFIEGYEQIGAN